MTSRYSRSIKRFFLCSTLVCLFASASAFADVNVWYEIDASSASADGVSAVSQGASGAPLIITVAHRVTSYAFTITCKAHVTQDDALIGYAIDIIAPNDSIVSSVEDDFIYLSTFGYYLPPTFGTAPGKLIAGAAEFDPTGQFGDLTLFTFILRVNGEVQNDVDIFSGIGDFLWGTTANLGVEVQFADSDLLDGEVDGGVSSTPSIIIRPFGVAVDDCNDNHVDDADEIDADPTLDCNTNGVLDECEITDGTGTDCNTNGILDACDIAEGTSADCNTNGVPDECDLAADATLDCNTNGILDACDIADGTSVDCDVNGVPDECDLNADPTLDCNSNGILDSCDIHDETSADCNENDTPDECDLAADATLDCNSNGILDSCDIHDETSADCNENGTPDECDIATAQALDCNENGVPDACDLTAGTSLDCNENGVPDSCDIATQASLDCNANGVPDDCDLSQGTAADCNGNALPDACEIAIGSVTDCNSNGIPDECDIPDGNSPDCNSNGVPDECDIAAGTSTDADGNGVPDECAGTGGQEQPQGNKVVDRGQLRTFLSLLFNIPGEGRPTLSGAPLYLFNLFGAPMSAVLFVMETISLPARAFMFAITYMLMDAFLP